MDYEVSDALLKGLVALLRPAKEDLIRKPEILDGINILHYVFFLVHLIRYNCCKFVLLSLKDQVSYFHKKS